MNFSVLCCVGQIQEESGARLHFTDRNSDGDKDRTVLIRGDTESAQKAELMIRQMLADMPATITEEVEVPGYCIGRIIGMCPCPFHRQYHQYACVWVLFLGCAISLCPCPFRRQYH